MAQNQRGTERDVLTGQALVLEVGSRCRHDDPNSSQEEGTGAGEEEEGGGSERSKGIA